VFITVMDNEIIHNAQSVARGNHGPNIKIKKDKQKVYIPINI
jgi:hypothetical protein